MCGNRACAVDTIENEEQIPEIWRAEELSKLQGPSAKHPGRQQQKQRPKARPLQGMLGDNVDESCVFEVDDECDERDYCVPEDEGATAKGDYVSLRNNTERFTGYAGQSARQVWDSIYKENCFTGSNAQSAGVFARGLHSVIQEYGRQQVNTESDLYPLDDQCQEQRTFYRIISGMHASISTHICWDYLNQTTGRWSPNMTCYKERLHNHPERISNLYFNYALVTRAVSKLKKHFNHYTFCNGDADQDFETKQKVLELADRVSDHPTTFDENVLFVEPQTLELKEDFKHRFRNVSRLMDCVGCDRCRLWGKLQTAGYGAALKVLFEFDENKNGENPHLRRTELVALINTLDRISHSLTAIKKFRAAINFEDERYLEGAEDLPLPVYFGDEKTQATDEEDDWVYDYSKKESDTSNRRDEPETLAEIFWDEFSNVWKAYIYVLKSWVSMPFKAWAIIIMELNRLWDYWLGLPVPPRSWKIHMPRMDEL